MVAYHHPSFDRGAFERKTAETSKRSCVFESRVGAKFTSYAESQVFSPQRFTAVTDLGDVGFVRI